jgi:hypothetical protein
MVLIRSRPFSWWPNFLRRLLTCMSMLRSNGDKLAAQHFLNQIFSFDYLTGIAQQNFEQIVFNSGEFNYFPRAADIARVAVHFDVADANGFTRGSS